eukprot:c10923_g1_i1.p1 GENE.c10923_g1_i1~~c10923_g1_i1.p1  ORF type:complete len:424 (+),score=122.70 c10923_g1_i1:255-1526(+)
MVATRPICVVAQRSFFSVAAAPHLRPTSFHVIPRCTASSRPIPLARVAVSSFHATARAMQSAKKDFYELLGTPRDASEADLKKAYYKAAKKYHPDQNREDPDAARKFSEINEAYEVLKNPEKRAMYDQHGHEGVGDQARNSQADFRQAEAIFREFSEFFEGFGMQSGRRSQKAADVQVTLNLTFEEAVFGAVKDVRYRRPCPCGPCQGSGAQPGTKKTCTKCKGSGQETVSAGFVMLQTLCSQCEGMGHTASFCTTCKGEASVLEAHTVQVNVPAGIESGVSMRVPGQGAVGVKGQNGTLYVRVTVEPHAVFEREGNDIHVKVHLTMSEAALGTSLSIPLLKGSEKITVKPGTQHGEVKVLHGKGVKVLGKNSHGDMLVHFLVQIPKNLTTEQQALLQQYSSSDKLDNDATAAMTKLRSFIKR